MQRPLVGGIAGAAWIMGFGMAAGCAGPQALRTAIRPQDDADYQAALDAADKDARLAFARWMAAERGATAEAVLAADAGVSERSKPFAATDERAVSRGAVLFKQHCATCHGDDASGGGTFEREDHPAANLRGFSKRTSTTLFRGPASRSLYEDIRDGHGPWIEEEGRRFRVMPAFGERLTREQLWLLVTYLQSKE